MSKCVLNDEGKITQKVGMLLVFFGRKQVIFE